MTLRIGCVTLDCADNDRVARFWEVALGYERTDHEGQYILARHPERSGPVLIFQQVVEAKPGKNRMHLDLHADHREAEVMRLVQLGARRGVDVAEHGSTWTTMYDVEDNEFCVDGPDAACAPG